MPKRGAKRTRTGRRPARRQRRRKLAVNVNRALTPIAQRYITKLKYSEALSLNVTLGVPNVYRFNLNSLFDPNRTGAGHQPYGFDQLTPLYNRYRVISCAYMVSLVTASNYLQAAALPTNSPTTTFNSVDHMRESPRARYILQAPNAPIKTLRGKVYIPSLLGRTKAQYMADDNYQAIYNQNPAELAILDIGVAPVGSDVQNFGYALNITLIYTAEFFDIQQQDQS